MGLEQFWGELELKPLYWTLDYIAEQTDEQILMALWASHKRAKEMEDKQDVRSTELFDPDKASEEEQKVMMISLGYTLGLSREAIQAQWASLNPDKSPMVFPDDGLDQTKGPDLTKIKPVLQQVKQIISPNKNLKIQKG